MLGYTPHPSECRTIPALRAAQRDFVVNCSDFPVFFGAERSAMSFGITRVGIPPGHLMGRKEAPSLLKFEWTPNEHKHIKVRGVLEL